MDKIFIKGNLHDLWTIISEKESEGYNVQDTLFELRTNYYVDTQEMKLVRDYSILLIEEDSDKIREIETIWKGSDLSYLESNINTIGFIPDDFKQDIRGRISGVKNMEITHYTCIMGFTASHQ